MKFAQIALGFDAPRVVLVDAFVDVEGASLGAGGRVNLIWVLVFVLDLVIVLLCAILGFLLRGLQVVGDGGQIGAEILEVLGALLFLGGELFGFAGPPLFLGDA